MPYIKQEMRNKIADEIEALAEKIKYSILDGDDDTSDNSEMQRARAGVLNFTICTLISLLMKVVNYNNINEVVGVLECAKLELYRRVAAPYEDKKIEENQDIYWPTE